MATAPHAPSNLAPVTLRPLAASDLDAVVAIDAAAQGRTRRDYIERRLRAARREGALHVQFGAVAGGSGGELLGFMLARVLEGEFGRRQPVLRLELLGVREAARGAGIGRQLLEALAQWAGRHGCGEIVTAADWRDQAMLAWFEAMGFSLAPQRIVECVVDALAWQRNADETAEVAPAEPAGVDAAGSSSGEIDYGRHDALGGNDFERQAHAIDVRTMNAADLGATLEAVARIDRRITGGDRRPYIAARLTEALEESAVRVSLVAYGADAGAGTDAGNGTAAGYLMARADLGDFGRTEPVAVIDTLGVEPAFAHRGVGRALVSQLFAHLGALRVERVETQLADENAALAAFFRQAGFVPSQRLVFRRAVQAAG